MYFNCLFSVFLKINFGVVKLYSLMVYSFIFCIVHWGSITQLIKTELKKKNLGGQMCS